MDFSKAFYTINHDLLLSKLKAYGLTENPVSFIRSYLANRYQRTKIGSTFSGWNKIITRVPQGSVLGPLFFKFLLMIWFYLRTYLKLIYVDDNTLYPANKKISQIMSDLSNDFETLTKWFYDNYTVLNPDKCHFMTPGFQDQNFEFHYENVVIENSTKEKILGISIDNKLCSKSHIINICTVANQRLSTICRISTHIDSYKCWPMHLLNLSSHTARSHLDVLHPRIKL